MTAMSGHRSGFFLFILLAGLTLFDQYDCVWIEAASDQYVCEGGFVLFKWVYNDTVEIIRGAAIYKSGLPPIDILAKEKDRNVSISMDGYSFLPNAGFKISNVTLAQAGQYNVRVVFENSSYNLADEKNLYVYPASDCPILEAYTQPNITVTVIDVESKADTLCDVITSSLPINISVTTTVPRGNPAVEAFIDSKSAPNATCYGAVNNDTSCTKQVSVTSYGIHSIEVQLAYIAYERQKTIIHCNIEKHMPLWNYMIAIIIIGCFILLVLLIFLICCIHWCCKKYCGREIRPKDKDGSDPPENIPMVSYRPPVEGTPKNETPVQVRDDESVDPYKCYCSFCPEDANEYCCQEIATFESLTDDHRCITQTARFRDIFRKQKQRPVSNEERRRDAFRELGRWIWHMGDKQSGFPACFIALAETEFPMLNAPA